MSVTFSSKLYGQHLIPEKVIRSLRGHLEDPNPSKALVLSFHGWTGTGKNYVSHMIVDHLYEMGYKSQYVKLFVPTSDFIHKENVPQYKVRAICIVIHSTRILRFYWFTAVGQFSMTIPVTE